MAQGVKFMFYGAGGHQSGDVGWADIPPTERRVSLADAVASRLDPDPVPSLQSEPEFLLPSLEPDPEFLEPSFEPDPEFLEAIPELRVDAPAVSRVDAPNASTLLSAHG